MIPKSISIALLKQFYRNKNVMITAGPTQENIDDVRFISNRSSGKMGYAIAQKASELGANVSLISGPVHIKVDFDADIINVVSAQEMYEQSMKIYQSQDIIIMSAAVADFRPKNIYAGKIKKSAIQSNLTIELEPTKDILFELSKLVNASQILVGFALESKNEVEYGIKKLKEKNCDMIVVNSTSIPDSAFYSDNNTITIIKKDLDIIEYPSMSKQDCAIFILDQIRSL